MQSEIKQPTVEEPELSSVAAARKAQEVDKKDHLNKLRIKYVKRVKCGICAGTILLLIICIAISVPCSLFAFNVIGNIFPSDAEEAAKTTIKSIVTSTMAAAS
uniref:Uncharacterized protein n=1 Tax=Panagrolaimus sp. ES5 TaxID=591445 RepID=A0AC34GKV5_9BILA